MTEWTIALLSFAVHDLIVIVLVPVVLLRRKDAAATIAWILAILMMPLVGAIVFLAFGNTRLERRAMVHRKRKKKVRGLTRDFFRELVSPIDIKGQMQLYRLLRRINPMHALGGNAVEVLTDMHRNYDLQIEAIDQAKHHVHVEYYIFEADTVGIRFQEALIAAARRGVEVRFLYDAVGSMNLTRSFLRRMHDAGIQTASFIPFRLFTHRWIFNFRNHRKILVVDGKVGFTGGANIGDEHLGSPAAGTWSDTHVRVKGPVVTQLQRVFAEDWAYAAGEELTSPEFFRDVPAAGDVVAEVVPGGPDLDIAIYHELYFSAVVNAVERIRITTPYFVPSDEIVMALINAARRGVDVGVLVPKVSSHLFVQLAAESNYQDLLEAGVKIYEYKPGFLHSKVLTIDNRWSIIGTANFDNRSMRLNFEIGIVLYDVELSLCLDRLFEKSVSESDRLNQADWNQRSILRRIAHNSARLFSPVL